jgi:prolipoprotein diacylglyceryltransferase
MFGMFLMLIFGFRFVVEFIKDVQVDFEKSMALNMGQWLSLPLVLLGFWLWYRSRQSNLQRA